MGSWKNNRYRSPVRSTYTSSLSSGTPLSLYGFSPSSYGVSSGYSSRSRLYSPSSTYIPSYSTSGYGSPSYSYISRYRDTSWSSYYTSAPRNDWYEAYRPTVRKRPSFSSDYTPSSSRRSSAATVSPSQSISKRGTINRQRKTIKFVDPKRKDSIPLDLTRIRRLSDAIADSSTREEADSAEQSPSHNAKDDSVEPVSTLGTTTPDDVEVAPSANNGTGDQFEERQARPRRRSRDAGANHDRRAKRVSMDITDVICEEEEKLKSNDLAKNDSTETHPQVLMAVTNICDKKFELEAKESPRTSDSELVPRSPKRSQTPETKQKVATKVKKGGRSPSKEKQHSPESRGKCLQSPNSRTRVRKAAEQEKQSPCETIPERARDEFPVPRPGAETMDKDEKVPHTEDQNNTNAPKAKPGKNDKSSSSSMSTPSTDSAKDCRPVREATAMRDSDYHGSFETTVVVEQHEKLEGSDGKPRQSGAQTKRTSGPAMKKDPRVENPAAAAKSKNKIPPPAKNQSVVVNVTVDPADRGQPASVDSGIETHRKVMGETPGAGTCASQGRNEEGHGIESGKEPKSRVENQAKKPGEIKPGVQPLAAGGREPRVVPKTDSETADGKKVNEGPKSSAGDQKTAKAGAKGKPMSEASTMQGLKADHEVKKPGIPLPGSEQIAAASTTRVESVGAPTAVKKHVVNPESLSEADAISKVEAKNITKSKNKAEAKRKIEIAAAPDGKKEHDIGHEAVIKTVDTAEKGKIGENKLDGPSKPSDSRSKARTDDEKPEVVSTEKAKKSQLGAISKIQPISPSGKSSSGTPSEAKLPEIRAGIKSEDATPEVVEKTSNGTPEPAKSEPVPSLPETKSFAAKTAEKKFKRAEVKEEKSTKPDRKPVYAEVTIKCETQNKSGGDPTQSKQVEGGTTAAQTVVSETPKSAPVAKREPATVDQKTGRTPHDEDAARSTGTAETSIETHRKLGKVDENSSVSEGQLDKSEICQKSASTTILKPVTAPEKGKKTEAILRPPKMDASNLDQSSDEYSKGVGSIPEAITNEDKTGIPKTPKHVVKAPKSPGKGSGALCQPTGTQPSASGVKAAEDESSKSKSALPEKSSDDSAAKNKKQKLPGVARGDYAANDPAASITDAAAEPSASTTSAEPSASTTSAAPSAKEPSKVKKTEQPKPKKKPNDHDVVPSKKESKIDTGKEVQEQIRPLQASEKENRSVECPSEVTPSVTSSESAVVPSPSKITQPPITKMTDNEKGDLAETIDKKPKYDKKKQDQVNAKADRSGVKIKQKDGSDPNKSKGREPVVSDEAVRAKDADAQFGAKGPDKTTVQGPEPSSPASQSELVGVMGSQEQQPEVERTVADILDKVDAMACDPSDEAPPKPALKDRQSTNEPEPIERLNRAAPGKQRLELVHSASIDCLLPVKDDGAVRAKSKSKSPPEIPKKPQVTAKIRATIEDQNKHGAVSEVQDIPRSQKDSGKAHSEVESVDTDEDARSFKDSLSDEVVAVKPPKSIPATEVRPSPSDGLSKEQQLALESRLSRAHTSDKAVAERRATDEIIRHKNPDQPAVIRFRKYSLLDFHLLKVLGKGSFGKVFLVELRDVPIYFAMKCLKKDVVLEDDDVECTLVERQVLSLGSHNPFICKLFCTFQTDSHLFFVMEFLRGGDLMFHVQNEGSFTEDRARFYGAEIVCALKFLHRRGIVYRDLKLDNVCLDGEGHIRLIDFGMCVPRVYRYEPTAFCGTPEYMAPEVIEGKHYNYAVDWWSFGVVMYEMLRGRSPYTGCDEDELFWNVLNTEVEYPKYFTRESKDLIQSLLQRDPELRLGMPESGRGDIKDHGFFYGTNWSQVEKKQLTPQFRPFNQGANDVSNFDEDFTKEPAVLTPVAEGVLATMDQELFKEFSYTNPNMTT